MGASRPLTWSVPSSWGTPRTARILRRLTCRGIVEQMLKADAQISRRWPRWWALAGLLGALGLGLVRFLGSPRPVHEAEWWIGDLALAGVFAIPALLVLAGKDRREVLVAAAIVSLPVAVLAMSGVTLPLLAPGVAYFIAAVHATPSRDAYRSMVLLFLACGVAAGAFAFLLFGSRTVVCWHETRYANDRLTVVRDRAAEADAEDGSMSGTSGPPSRGVVSRSSSCNTGAFSPIASALALASSGVLLVAARRVA
jgi:hypothetical protein